MNINVIIDWKFVVALGIGTAGIILATKMDEVSAERVSMHAVDAFENYVIAGNSNH